MATGYGRGRRDARSVGEHSVLHPHRLDGFRSNTSTTAISQLLDVYQEAEAAGRLTLKHGQLVGTSANEQDAEEAH